MKQAAVHALAELARRGEAVPAVVKRAYPNEQFDFGPSYIIPKPFDPRVLQFVCPAVAQAAMDVGRRAQADRPRAVRGRGSGSAATEIAKL